MRSGLSPANFLRQLLAEKCQIDHHVAPVLGGVFARGHVADPAWDPFIPGDIGVAGLQQPGYQDGLVGVFVAQSRGAGHHQLAVPHVRQPEGDALHAPAPFEQAGHLRSGNVGIGGLKCGGVNHVDVNFVSLGLLLGVRIAIGDTPIGDVRQPAIVNARIFWI